MVIIRNLARTLFVLNLEHRDYSGHAACKPQELKFVLPAETEDGTKGTRHIEKKVPASITWLAGQESEPLPDAVAEAPQIRLRVAQGLMSVVRLPEAPTPHAEEHVIEIE